MLIISVLAVVWFVVWFNALIINLLALKVAPCIANHFY